MRLGGGEMLPPGAEVRWLATAGGRKHRVAEVTEPRQVGARLRPAGAERKVWNRMFLRHHVARVD